MKLRPSSTSSFLRFPLVSPFTQGCLNVGAALCFLWLPFSAAAQTLFWDSNGTASGSGNQGGVWDADSCWTTDFLGQAATSVWQDGSTAVFSAGSDGVGAWEIKVQDQVKAASVLIKDSGAKTISGGVITIHGTLDTKGAGSTNTVTVSSKLTGSNGLTIEANGNTSETGGSQGGALALRGANNFSGDVTILAGVVDPWNSSLADSLGHPSNRLVLAGGGIVDKSNNLKITREIHVPEGSTGIYRTYSSVTAGQLNGRITGSGNLMRTDGGASTWLTIHGDGSAFTGTLTNARANLVIGPGSNNWEHTEFVQTDGDNKLWFRAPGEITIKSLRSDRDITIAGGSRLNIASGIYTTVGAGTSFNGFIVQGETALDPATTGEITSSSQVLSITNGQDEGNLTTSMQQLDVFVVDPAPDKPLTLEKHHNNQLRLSMANSYSGGTLITGGRIHAVSPLSFGAGAVTIADGSQAYLNKDNAVFANDFILNGPGTVESAGVLGALRFQNLTVSGNIHIASKARIAAYNNFWGVHTGKLTGADDLEIGHPGLTGAITLSGDASGFLGDLILNNNNTVNAGALGGGLQNLGGVANLSGPLGGALLQESGVTNLIAGASVPELELMGGTLNILHGASVAGDLEGGGPAGFGLAGSLEGTLTLNLEDILHLRGGSIGGDLILAGESDLILDTAVHVAGNVNLQAPAYLEINSYPAPGSPVVILQYGGTFSGNVADLILLTPYGHRKAEIAHNSLDKTLAVDIGSKNLVWEGSLSDFVNDWEENWVGGELFHTGDGVVFGDGATSFDLTLEDVLQPSAVLFDNSAENPYTITGGGFAGGATLVKEGEGEVWLGGVNTYTGGTEVRGGTLIALSNQAFGANGSTITVAEGASVDVNGQITEYRDYHAFISGAGPEGEGALVNNSGVALQRGFGSISLTGDAVIGGLARFDLRPATAGTARLNLNGHTLTKTGTNIIAMVDGVVSNDGDILIQQGTLAFSRLTAEGPGSIKVAEGATLHLENYTSGSFSKPVELEDFSTLRASGAHVVLNSDLLLNGIPTLLVSNNSLTFTRPISGPGGLLKTGAGSLILTASNSYQGETVVEEGGLELRDGATIPSDSIELGYTGGVILNHSDDLTFTTPITGTGISGNNMNPSALTKAGTNTVTLVAANTFTGSTRIGGGMIAIGSDESVFGAGDPGSVIDLRGGGIRSSDGSPRLIPNDVSFSAAAVFGSPGTGSLTFTGSISLGSGDKTADVRADIVEFQGMVNGSGSGTALTKTGPGTLVLSNDNYYSQNTVVREGVLRIGNGGESGGVGYGNLVNDAAVVIHRGDPVALPVYLDNLISGTGTLTHAGPSHTVLTAMNSYTGDTVVNDGVLALEQPFLADSAAVRISGSGVLELEHGETDAVGALHLDGVAQEPGLWGAPGARAAHGNPAINETPRIAGQGLLSVGAAGSAYDEWAAARGLDAGNSSPDADPDGDGRNNLAEFAFDGNPVSGADEARISGKTVAVGGSPRLTLTLPVRAAVGVFAGDQELSASGDGLTYVIEAGTDLATWNLPVLELAGPDAAALQAGLPALSDGGWVYRSFYCPDPVETTPQAFIRARVSE